MADYGDFSTYRIDDIEHDENPTNHTITVRGI